jgi:hypothetical protein
MDRLRIDSAGREKADMIDGYAHLDAGAADPLSDLRTRMTDAGVNSALAVETWKGDTRGVLESVSPSDQHVKIALCYRGDLDSIVRHDALRCVRVKTADLEAGPPWLGIVAESGKCLLPHAEYGIGRLTSALLHGAETFPGLRIYVPHLCWPVRDGEPNPDWLAAIESLSRVRGLIAGVSAMAHFSREDFPHEDVRRIVEPLLRAFGPERLTPATDYPQFDKSRYAAYISLAGEWIRSAWPDWKEPDALLT